MRKKRSYNIFQRIISIFLTLCIVLSLCINADQSKSFQNIITVNAEENPDEYKNETLEYAWNKGNPDTIDKDYWNASRPYYACACTPQEPIFAQFGGVYKRTIFHVYAFEGDTICVGSSVYNSGLDLNHNLKSEYRAVSGKSGYESTNHYPDEGSIDVVMTDLNGNTHPIDIRNTDDDKTGYIATPEVEYAAVIMKKQPDGTYKGTYKGEDGTVTYTPYTYKVQESGVYTFEFHSYDKTGTTNPNGKPKRSDQWPTDEHNYIDAPYKDKNGNEVCNDAGGLIAALDLTVFNENGEKQTGRAYADFLSLQMNLTSKDNGICDTYYILTTDSYIYKMKFNGAAPYTYNFFSNNRGIYDSATGEIVYKSVKDIGNQNTFQRMGTFFKYPGTKDTEKDKSFYIFLEYPDDDLYGHLYERAIQPDPATNIRFVSEVEVPNDTGSGVHKVPGSYVGVGGYFAFDVKEATTATLRLEFKGVKPPADSGGASGAALSIEDTSMPFDEYPSEDMTTEAAGENVTETGTAVEEATENSTESESAAASETETSEGSTEAIVIAEASTESEISTENNITTEEMTEEVITSEEITTTEALTEETVTTEEVSQSADAAEETTEAEFSTESDPGYIDNEEQIPQTTALDIDPDYEYAPVEISGVVTPNSTNYFYWNGCDGNGVPIPAGEYKTEDIVFTVTTKAGEIHFPIFDMEYAKNGITFTRMSHVYNKEGTQLDTDDNIYGLTKNVIYYDETAIYYGENVAVTGISENQVDVAKDFFSKAENEGKYWTYYNIRQSGGGEFEARKSAYIGETNVNDIGSNKTIRVGDHSHTTNVIQFFDDTGEVLKEDEITQDQKKMIEYLNSSKYPVGKSAGTTATTGGNSEFGSSKIEGTTTDYAIANYWTFIPAQPAHSDGLTTSITIVDDELQRFSLTGRVFYDAKRDTSSDNGKFNDSGENGEHILSGVTLNLYRQTKDLAAQAGKTYYKPSDTTMTAVSNFTAGEEVYELVDTGITTNSTDGYVFSGLEYDKENGTNYIYQVVRPDPSYGNPTSTGVTALVSKSGSTPYGYYARFNFGTNYKGTELQKIKVGGTGGIDPKVLSDGTENPSHRVCAVDVGYYYATLDHDISLKKEWKTEATHPDAVVFEVSYLQNSQTKIYTYKTLSGGSSWTDKDQFFPQNIGGNPVQNYYVSAEYFIYDEAVWKYTFDYDPATGKYHSFVGEASKVSLDDVFEGSGKEKPSGNCTISDLPDKNKDGIVDGKDLGAITGWVSVDEKSAAYRAVLDRNMPSSGTTMTITNSTQHGTIEIYKYYDLYDPDESNALQGATFRLYEGAKDTVKGYVESNNLTALNKIQVDSATTRQNGRVAFSGLDPEKTYTVREVFAPDGYRILEEYFEVEGKTATAAYHFNDQDYVEIRVGNAQADNTFLIRKQITGRAWQNDEGGSKGDSFTFTVANGFKKPDNFSDISSSPNISVDMNEQAIQQNGAHKEQNAILEELELFAKNFRSGGAHSSITIDYNDEYYSYKSQTAGRPEVTITSADTKMSDELLTGSKETADSKPAFCGVEFPMAGVYTFTITENEVKDQPTLETSKFEYTVSISVIRKLNTGEDGEITYSNSHLEAEVSNISYKESADGDSQVFPSSSPLFTNTYTTAPAEQSTTYAIQKVLNGRDWLTTDEFTVSVRSANPETINAIKNGNLVITGFENADIRENITKLADGEGWTYTFKGTDKEKDGFDTLNFTSFKFNKIEFPVQYVKENSDGSVEVWKPEEHGDQITPPEDKIKDYTPQTMPITYELQIQEQPPTGATGNVLDGITYDTSVYTLEIILNNTEGGSKIGSGEEEDGVIEEIDLNLYKGTAEDKGTLVADCKTRQEVLEDTKWLDRDVTPPDGGTYTWWYVDDKGNLKASTGNPTAKPTGAKLLIRKKESHKDESDTDGHIMTVNNEYHMSYEWTPQVEKVLEGRSWAEKDAFTFTLKCTKAPDGVEPPEDQEITIPYSETDDYSKFFDKIEFSKPGTYEFTITESSHTADADSLTHTVDDIESGEYTITVELTDDGKGHLLADFNGYDYASPVIFTNIYTDVENPFELAIEKQIIGRNWNDEDVFTFEIVPEDTITKEAIGEYLEMPDGYDPTEGSYTVTVRKSDAAGTATVTDTVIKSLGEITVKKGADTDQEYHFTISEVNIPSEMRCREPDIELTINVNREKNSDTGIATGNLVVSATFAYMSASGSEIGKMDPDSKKVTFPFDNVCIGELTVEKQVVSNAETDDTDFNFRAVFTYDDTEILESDRTIKAQKDSTVVEPEIDGNTWTYSFTLKHGEKVVFSNIPSYTEYTVAEDPVPDDYMLLRVRETAEDIGENLLEKGETGTKSREINGDQPKQYLLFINGKINELPAAGGPGARNILRLGIILVTAAGLYFMIRYKKKKCRIEPDG